MLLTFVTVFMVSDEERTNHPSRHYTFCAIRCLFWSSSSEAFLHLWLLVICIIHSVPCLLHYVFSSLFFRLIVSIDLSSYLLVLSCVILIQLLSLSCDYLTSVILIWFLEFLFLIIFYSFLKISTHVIYVHMYMYNFTIFILYLIEGKYNHLFKIFFSWIPH